MSKFKGFVEAYKQQEQEEYSLEEYLELCKTDKMAFASPAERILAAIGEPEMIDTQKDPVLGRVFQNRTIKTYPAFRDFFGMEDVIEQIVGFFTHAAQGLEEKKQVFYLLGPVGGGKSSLAERVKELMEENPIYVLKAGDELSPCFESPLSLFDKKDIEFVSEYGISENRLNIIMSPWAVKRLDEYQGDISKFSVVKVYPSKLRQRAVVKTEPGDDNNQDISSLVGKVDLRKLDNFHSLILMLIVLVVLFVVVIKVSWSLLKCSRRLSRHYIRFLPLLKKEIMLVVKRLAQFHLRVL